MYSERSENPTVETRLMPTDDEDHDPRVLAATLGPMEGFYYDPNLMRKTNPVPTDQTSMRRRIDGVEVSLDAGDVTYRHPEWQEYLGGSRKQFLRALTPQEAAAEGLKDRTLRSQDPKYEEG
jgi:hypothetical protein